MCVLLEGSAKSFLARPGRRDPTGNAVEGPLRRVLWVLAVPGDNHAGDLVAGEAGIFRRAEQGAPERAAGHLRAVIEADEIAFAEMHRRGGVGIVAADAAEDDQVTGGAQQEVVSSH